MNRRHFLTRALASVPVVLAGAELAELLAPRKSIFLPPRGGWGGRWGPPSEYLRGWYYDIVPGGYDPNEIITITVKYPAVMPRGVRIQDMVLVGDSDWGITV